MVCRMSRSCPSNAKMRAITFYIRPSSDCSSGFELFLVGCPKSLPMKTRRFTFCRMAIFVCKLNVLVYHIGGSIAYLMGNFTLNCLLLFTLLFGLRSNCHRLIYFIFLYITYFSFKFILNPVIFFVLFI